MPAVSRSKRLHRAWARHHRGKHLRSRVIVESPMPVVTSTQHGHSPPLDSWLEALVRSRTIWMLLITCLLLVGCGGDDDDDSGSDDDVVE